MKVVILGSGNVASHLALAISKSGHSIAQIFSKTYEHAAELADKVGAQAASSLDQLDTDADLYLFSVTDNALPLLAEQMPRTKGVWAHTAGSVSVEVLAKHKDYGVFYPLQTFSRCRKLDYATLPIYLDYYSELAKSTLEEMAGSITACVYKADDNQRKQLHLAAVFACNFTNHIYAIAEHLLSEAGLPAEALAPLIKETADKINILPAGKAQTGPAARRDTDTMQKHLNLLSDDNLKKVYRMMSDSIINSKLKTNRE